MLPTYTDNLYAEAVLLAAASRFPEKHARERKREWETIASTSSELKQSVPMYGPLVVSDDIELDAQVPAEVSPGAGQRHPEASLLDLQELRFQGNGVYRGDRLSEREGEWTSASYFR